MESHANVESICWLTTQGMQEMDTSEQNVVMTKLVNIICCEGFDNVYVCKEYVALYSVLRLLTCSCEKEPPVMDNPRLDKYIKDIDEEGEYNVIARDFRSICRYIHTPGNDKHGRFNNIIGIVIGYLCRKTLTTEFSRSINNLSYDSTSDGLLRMRHMLSVLSQKCTYERTGDIYIHTLLKSKLPTYISSLIVNTGTPYDAISKYYDSDANDLVRPFMNTDPDVKFDNVQWQSTTDLDGFHFLVGLLREFLDGCDCTLLYNHTIARGLRLSRPYFFVMSNYFHLENGVCFGYGVGNKLWIAPQQDPHLLTIHGFLTAHKGKQIPSLTDFYSACFSPDSLPSSSPFYALCEDFVKL